MKFGLLLNHEYPTSADLTQKLADLVVLTQTARELGFDSLFGLQHYVSSLATFQPLPLLGHLASHADGMEIGTGVYLATLEHPVQLAENFATLDHLCGGRLILGLGAGYRHNEFDAFSVDRATRWSRLAETIELVRALWSGEEVNHAGRHFAVAGHRLRLVPQQPCPPIWIGANAEATIRRAARMGGDAWLAPPNVKRRWAKGHLEIFEEELAANGFETAGRRRPIIRELCVAETDAAAAEIEPFIREEYAEFSQYGIDFWRTMFDDLSRKAFLFGSADTVAEGIADLAAGGFDEFIFRVSWGSLPLARAVESLERFAREVRPLLGTSSSRTT